MSKINLNKIKKIHFIGIGGIGISAIAKMMALEGKEVSGSDASENKITDQLKKLRVIIHIGHSEKNFDSDVELVIYTIAITKDNPELKKARRLKIPILSYPQALGALSKDHYTVAISGTHGKTTTTAMIAKICIDAGLEPTVIVGSLLDPHTTTNKVRTTKGSHLFSVGASNFIAGKSNLFIVEACEYRESFLNLYPRILAITNIDNDHLDYYKTVGNIYKAFKKIARKIPSTGYLICNLSNKEIRRLTKGLNCHIIDYSLQPENITLKVPGQHNRENAKIALAIAEILKVERSRAKKYLKGFSGTWRRFEYKGKTKTGTHIYDDYAHHPTEIKASLSAFRERFPRHKITVVFQPHLFSRTKALLNDFADSFNDADKIILAPIYAAREKPSKGISSKILFKKLKKKKNNVLFFENFEKIEKYLKLNPHISKNDIIITMGAGDIYKIGEALARS